MARLSLEEAVHHRKTARSSAEFVRALAVERAIREALGRGGLLVSRLGHIIKFDPEKHPRDRRGQFIEVLKKLGVGQKVTLPGGDTITKRSSGGYHYEPAQKSLLGGPTFDIAAEVADHALQAHDYHRRETKRKVLTGSVPPGLATAYEDWAANRAYLDNGGNYRLSATGKVAPWNRDVKRYYPTRSSGSKMNDVGADEFARDARAWKGKKAGEAPPREFARDAKVARDKGHEDAMRLSRRISARSSREAPSNNREMLAPEHHSKLDTFSHEGPGGDQAMPSEVRDALTSIPPGGQARIGGVRVSRSGSKDRGRYGDYHVGKDRNLASPWVAMQSIQAHRKRSKKKA